MKKYALLQPLYLSFFSRDLYRDVGKNWKGTGFLYLLLLLALAWMPVMYKVHWGLSKAVRESAPKFVDQVPKVTILRGEVSVDRPVPYTITDPGSRTPLLVIDTSGTITSLDQAKAPALLTRNKFMYRKRDGAETRIYDLSRIDAFTLDRDRVNRWVQAFRMFFAAVAYPFALAASFAYRVLQMLLYAAVGLLFANILKTPLDYLTVLRLASISITPVVLLSMLRTVAGLRVPLFGLLCFAIAMGYLFFAVRANAAPEGPETPAA